MVSVYKSVWGVIVSISPYQCMGLDGGLRTQLLGGHTGGRNVEWVEG